MGLTRQYLRYEHQEDSAVLGVIATGRCLKFVVHSSESGKYVAASAGECVYIWNLKTLEKVATLDFGVKGIVTSLEVLVSAAHTQSLLVVGFSDGAVGIYDVAKEALTKFQGHQKTVTTLTSDVEGHKVASGSENGDIVVWDVLSERGLVRFKGHTGKVTKLCFMESRNVLISAGADALIKFWNLDSAHCFYTLTGHTSEVADFLVMKNDSRLVTGCTGGFLRVWNLTFLAPTLTGIVKSEVDIDEEITETDRKVRVLENGVKSSQSTDDSTVNEESNSLEAKMEGCLSRTKGDRIIKLVKNGSAFSCLGKGKVIDSYVFLPEEEAEKRQEKRLKKYRKRLRNANEPLEVKAEPESIVLNDELSKLPSFSCDQNSTCIDLFTTKKDTLRIAALHKNNTISQYDLPSFRKTRSDSETSQWQHVSTVEEAGHRTDIRGVQFTSLGDQIVTASGESIKLWDRTSGLNKMTLSCEFALCLLLPPGDGHALIGTMSGKLQLYDLGSGALLQDTQAHLPNEHSESCIWSIAATSDKRGFVSGGADAVLRFWSYEMLTNEEDTSCKRLGFIKDAREMKVADQITAVRCSENGQYVSVATLDMKETIFFIDSLKLRHELYGKPMPATCMDFSDDTHIIVTGSKDSCLRIYGSDFGEERRLIKKAHMGGVTDCKFVPKTHFFFSCGVDGKLKQWDADNFQRILTLDRHHGIIRCLSVSPNGNQVVTCGQDRSIREWCKTDEPLILEEEREEERRVAELESNLGGGLQRVVVEGEQKSHAVRPSILTNETERAVDDLVEALDIYRKEMLAEPGAIPDKIMSLVYNTTDPAQFILRVLRRIKSHELDETILMLPFNYVLQLLLAVKNILEKDLDVELVTRVAVMVIRLNLPQLLASSQSCSILRPVGELVKKKIEQLQDQSGIVLAGLNFNRMVEEKDNEQLFSLAAQKAVHRRGINKKKRIQKESFVISLG